MTYTPMSSYESYIHSLCKQVIEEGKTVDRLSEQDLADLPMGIARQVGNTTYIIAIDSAYSNERGWFLSAYASIQLPGTTHPIAFAAKNIGFHAGGLSTTTQVKLLLVSSLTFPVNEQLSIELPADGRNFVEFDCNGFKTVNVKGNFIFSDAVFQPDTERAPEATSVKASFEVNTADVNNMMMSVQITPFRLRNLDDLSFEVRSAVADYSDIINPTGFVFPPDYQQAYGADIQLWRGFYLQEVAIRMSGFGADASKDPALTARNLLIDDMGVSGTFAASNLMALQDGSVDGWPISIDQLAVKLMFSKVAGGSLGGKLQVPFLGSEPVAYAAQMEQVNDHLNYKFSIATGEDKEFATPFAAKLKIQKGSLISLEKRQGKLIPSVSLTGILMVDHGMLKADDIRFQNLTLTSRTPYVTGGEFSTAGSKQPKSVGFPIRIDSIRMRIYQGQVGLGFGVALNLMNESDKGFAASTYIQILASMTQPAPAAPGAETPAVKQDWKLDKVKVNDISLECRTTAVNIAGRLTVFQDDATYGDGFRGSLSFSIKKVLERGIQVNGYFGSKPDFRYWHVDAYVPTAQIPVAPPLSINGFMGGASYHMTRAKAFTPDFAKLNNKGTATNDGNAEFAYVPDVKTGMAFMAGVSLIAGNDKVFNSDAVLEIAFNQNNGIRYANFRGSAYFFSAIADRGSNQGTATTVKTPVYANLNMLYDDDNNTFHANLKTYVNMLNVIRGTGPEGLVGEAVIHIDPNDWYVYIGRPSQMFGVDVAKVAVAQIYFMIGTQVENIPPPPPEVREVFDDINDGLMRDGTALSNGRGFAAGAHFRVGITSYDANGKSKINPFYFLLQVGAGVDFMLRDNGNAYCVGRTGRVGIDGWYASGQAYVFLKGKVGVVVKKKEFDIVSVGAAALLQAKLPNPTWLQGQLGGHYSILGGLVKGKFQVKMTIGEECELINPGGNLDDIPIIGDIKPDPNANEVSVFTSPQASFNTSLDTEFTMMEGSDDVSSYRVRLQEFKLTRDGVLIPSTIEWNESRDVAALRTSEILPPLSNLKAEVKVFWEKKNASGAWEQIRENGQVAVETKSTTFRTGAAPNFIPEENVAYSYPAKQQFNVYKDDSRAGYIKLKMGQEYLFNPTDGTSWSYLVRFKKSNGTMVEAPVTYDVGQAMVQFTVPTDLQSSSIYTWTIVKKPQATAIDQNARRSDVAVNTGAGNEATVASNKLEGNITQATEKDLYNSVFRTSMYATFQQKWESLRGAQDIFDVTTSGEYVLAKRGNLTEGFDEIELKGVGDQPPLIQLSGSPDPAWLSSVMSPLLYNNYPQDPAVNITWRDPNLLGVSPLRGVRLNNDIGNFKLTDAEVTAGSTGSRSSSVVVGYFIPYYVQMDFMELRDKAASRYISAPATTPASIKKLMVTPYTNLQTDTYPVSITYSLPGPNRVVYSGNTSIKF